MIAAPAAMPTPMTIRVAISHSYSGFFHQGSSPVLVLAALVSPDEETWFPISCCPVDLLGVWEQETEGLRKAIERKRHRILVHMGFFLKKGCTENIQGYSNFGNHYHNMSAKKSGEIKSGRNPFGGGSHLNNYLVKVAFVI
jgi:hypothetical protein